MWHRFHRFFLHSPGLLLPYPLGKQGAHHLLNPTVYVAGCGVTSLALCLGTICRHELQKGYPHAGKPISWMYTTKLPQRIARVNGCSPCSSATLFLGFCQRMTQPVVSIHYKWAR